jgi:hypothetical protein
VPGVAADLETDCQLYLPPKTTGSEATVAQASATQITIGELLMPFVELRLPAGTDVLAPVPWPIFASTYKTDYVEVPKDSGRYYVVVYVEDAHKGFPNEYRVAFIRQLHYSGARPKT